MLRAVVAYDGSELFGFQCQSNVPTVGGILEGRLAKVLHRPTPVVAAGRTDAGVHASGQVVSFEVPLTFPVDRLTVALNARLPRSVSLHDPQVMPAGWSARFAAIERRYVYVLRNAPENHALAARYMGFEPRRLDIGRMRAASRDLLGVHDFRSFCGTPPKNHTVRTLKCLTIAQLDQTVIRFELRADGFVHRMVRIIIGTLLEIGTGYRDAHSLPELLLARDRKQAGNTASPAGLYLAGVRYPDWEVFKEPPIC